MKAKDTWDIQLYSFSDIFLMRERDRDKDFQKSICKVYFLYR